ncbi:MAG: type II toxin-antitoxin system VapC family toxin [Micropepsaceae bacterium]
MIVDSSALVAILREESDAPAFVKKLVLSGTNRISASTYLETAVVLDRDRNPILSRRLDDFLKEALVLIAPFTETQARIAREAYRDFGRGSGHPAKLNFGDCFAYALAKEAGEPLLFKGNDFTHTGIEVA